MRRPLFLFLVNLISLSALAAPPSPKTVNLIGMGDWGNGSPMQKQVAITMADYVQKSGRTFNAALLAGDNFYGWLTSINDARWKADFETTYDVRRLNFPFYATAGNHDYEGSKLRIEMDYALQNPSSRWKFPARWYRVDLPSADAPRVTVLMLDSNKDYVKSDWAAEVKWIDDQLEDVDQDRAAHPNVTHWTIAVAHHPLFSNGQHGDIGPLQLAWGPAFKKHKLDFYLCGHDHDLQHLEIPGWFTSFVLTGGGGARGRDMRRDNRGPFSKRANGFTHFRFGADKATVNLVDSTGAVLHAFERSTAGQIKILDNVPSDPATKHQLRSLNGQGDDEDD